MRSAEHTLKLPTDADAASSSSVVVRRARYLMGTVWMIEAVAADKLVAQRAIGQAFDEVARIERWASRFLPTSDVAWINAAAGGESVACEPELVALLERCRMYTQLTDGAFDVTVGGALVDDPACGIRDAGHGESALLLHRGLTPQGSDPIGKVAIKRRSGQGICYHDGVWRRRCLTPSVGWAGEVECDRRRWVPGTTVGSRFLEVDVARCHVRLAKPGMAIDLGGVAKGYAVDRAVAVLRDGGVAGGSVNAGGNLRVFGSGVARTVAIRDPRVPSRALRWLTLSEVAVATSGNYERTVQGMDGHLVDPATGTAAAAGVLSVTVVADAAETADAYSTALFVMGVRRGVAWAQRQRIRAVMVAAQPLLWYRHRIAVTEIGTRN